MVTKKQLKNKEEVEKVEKKPFIKTSPLKAWRLKNFSIGVWNNRLKDGNNTFQLAKSFRTRKGSRGSRIAFTTSEFFILLELLNKLKKDILTLDNLGLDENREYEIKEINGKLTKVYK